MKREQIKKGQRIVEQIEDLRELRDEIFAKFPKLGEKSTEDEIREVFTLLISKGAGDILTSVIIRIGKIIYDKINALEKELDEL